MVQAGSQTVSQPRTRGTRVVTAHRGSPDVRRLRVVIHGSGSKLASSSQALRQPKGARKVRCLPRGRVQKCSVNGSSQEPIGISSCLTKHPIALLVMQSLARDAVVLFARLPMPGQVKTRLAAAVGNDAAALFYRRCAERIVAALAGCAGSGGGSGAAAGPCLRGPSCQMPCVC